MNENENTEETIEQTSEDTSNMPESVASVSVVNPEISTVAVNKQHYRAVVTEAASTEYGALDGAQIDVDGRVLTVVIPFGDGHQITVVDVRKAAAWIVNNVSGGFEEEIKRFQPKR